MKMVVGGWRVQGMLQKKDQRRDQNHQLEVVVPRLYFEVLEMRGWVRILCCEHLGGLAVCSIASAVQLAVEMLARVNRVSGITYCAQRVDEVRSSRISIVVFLLDWGVPNVKFELRRSVSFILRAGAC